MKTYSMQCSCGHTMVVDGKSKKEAVKKMKAMMTEDVVKDHMDKMHQGQELLTAAQVHAQIEMYLQEAMPVPV